MSPVSNSFETYKMASAAAMLKPVCCTSVCEIPQHVHRVFFFNTRETILTIQLRTVRSLDYLQHCTLLILYGSNYVHYLNYNIYTTYSTLPTNTTTTSEQHAAFIYIYMYPTPLTTRHYYCTSV